MTTTRQLHLNANIVDVGRHPAAWRAIADPAAFVDIDFYRDVARIAERGTLDAVFLSDGVALHEEPPSKPWNALEPTVLLAALAGATDHVGLIATASTNFNDPFNLARRIATLDHVSRGRAAWNIVTSVAENTAANFGLHHLPDGAERYARAEEFVEVVNALWDSWDDDALVGEPTAFTEAGGIRPIDHVGRFFSVRGPLNVPRPPQGRPVLVQAGASTLGRALASRYADIVFTAQPLLEPAANFYREIKAQAASFGRDPDTVTILPGLFPIIGGTEAEAKQRKEELDELLPFTVEMQRLAGQLGVHPDQLDLDRPLPYDRLRKPSTAGFFDAIVNLAREHDYTVRQLIAANGGGHRQVVGAPEQIADEIERWFVERAADGFNLNSDVFPSGLENFVDHVVPLLRRRGIFRTEYTGTTLRDHLGLAHPTRARSHRTLVHSA